MKYLILLILPILILSCTEQKFDSKQQAKETNTMLITETTIQETINELQKKFGEDNKFRIEKGVKQVADLWFEIDGTPEEFQEFCKNSFIVDEKILENMFNRLSDNFETLWGHMNKITLDLNQPVHLSTFDMIPIDAIFAGYSPGAHLTSDLFKNKIAFNVLLNFPHYSLDDKNELGRDWSRKQWAYARMGDIFVSRVPSELLQNRSEVMAKGDLYISEYNIYMGNLLNNEGNILFPKDLKLISHWGLRDELKSHYANQEEGLAKQEMIYEVMKRIISQEIPQDVVNNDKYQWNPYSNEVAGEEGIKFESEPNTRYQHIVNNFKAVQAIDEYSPNYPTYISRKFEQEFEIPQKTVEKLFTYFVSSDQVKQVSEIIKKRLGRDLKPWDIWYDGFKSRSSISEDDLNAKTMTKYPTPKALKGDLSEIMIKLGFDKDKAKQVASRIEVDPSRGAGHAWGAQMRSENAHLRTRIGEKGMDYKGYNIAVHELGHNVEQTLTLNDVDYYMLTGVPNTAFTEAWAFVFQKRDLELLGINENNPDKKALMIMDNLWSTYEIMGVSLVDMNLWKWLYENPDASAEDVKNAVMTIAKDVWNKYFAEVFGIKDQTILAIYSHMIDYPLYLSAYPLGHLIEFQIENYIQGKNLGMEMIRMCKLGRVTPKYWMIDAVGNELSIKPTLDAVSESINNFE